MSIVVPVLLGDAGGMEWPNMLGCASCFTAVAGTCEGRDSGVALGIEITGTGREEMSDAHAFCIDGYGGEPVDAARR